MALDLCAFDFARDRVRIELQSEPDREARENTWTPIFIILIDERRPVVQQLLSCEEKKFVLVMCQDIVIGTEPTQSLSEKLFVKEIREMVIQWATKVRYPLCFYHPI
jgi:hypothetical protein